MKKTAGILFAVILAAGLVVTASPSQAGIRNILILHSYHQGFYWTDSISRGIESELASMAGKIELHYQYLDTKRNSGRTYLDRLASFMQFKTRLNRIRYALIICSDNNALDFINRYGDRLYPDVPVVFCGINNYRPEMVQIKRPVTGVVETIDYEGTLALMDRIHPGRDQVLVILDRTTTGQAIKEEFDRVAIKFQNRFSFDYYQDFLLSDVPGRISKLGEKDLIYLLTFNRDKSGFFISYTDGIRMIRSASRVPIYGSWDFYFGNGIVGGAITSGESQGREAGRMAAMILSGTSAGSIPVRTEGTSQYMFDFRQMQAYDIKARQVPEKSRIIHLPLSLAERYRNQIISLLAAVSLAVVILAWRLVVQYRRQAGLKRLNLELDRRVEEQTSKLKDKNDRLKTEIRERIKLEAEIRTLAETDPLTGVLNRRSFMEKAESEFHRSQRYGHPLSAIMMDLDFFKKINDTHGHHAGDETLKTFTGLCQKALRKSDFLGRMGGEEFAVILVETDSTEAVPVAERIRTLAGQARIHMDGDDPVRFTVSLGVSQIRSEDLKVENSLLRADSALYDAKQNGRNKTCCR